LVTSAGNPVAHAISEREPIDCAKARAAYESPRYTAIAVASKEGDGATQDVDDPKEALRQIVARWIAADEAERAENAIVVSPAAEPADVIEPDDSDGELA
jgi:hypothetical protein